MKDFFFMKHHWLINIYVKFPSSSFGPMLVCGHYDKLFIVLIYLFIGESKGQEFCLLHLSNV